MKKALAVLRQWRAPPAAVPREDHRTAAAEIIRSCRDGKFERAAELLLDRDGGLFAPGVSPKQKLIHLLFLPRLLQKSFDIKHGPEKLQRKMRGLFAHLGPHYPPAGGAFVELGCGVHDPLALPACMYLNGYSPCLGIDLAEPANAVYSALSMYDILANVQLFPERYCRPGTAPESFQARLKDFDAAAFERGDYQGGFARLLGKVSFQATDVVSADIEPQSVSLVASYAVLEHVADIDAVCRKLFASLRPGGLVFHFVDLEDHRSYWNAPGAGKRFSALSFLTEEHSPDTTNRLRAPQIAEAHRRAGFEILKDTRRTIEVPEEILLNLKPPFRDMPLSEVGTIKQWMVARRPA